MSRTVLIAVVAGAVAVVAALAAITPTVLVSEHHGRGGERMMRFAGPGFGPLPGFRPGFRACVQHKGGPTRCRGFAPPLPGR